LALAAGGAAGIESSSAGTVRPMQIAARRTPQNAGFTLLDGQPTSLRAFAHRPLMVWFVANGCASCAVSIPTVARHLSAFRAAGVHVLVLGIYGEFGRGKLADTLLARFGSSTAGRSFRSPVWTWGVASARLTTMFDPSGIPDQYFLRDRAGQTLYRGVAPVSTIHALLSHLKEIS
jgi:hypothetical protein